MESNKNINLANRSPLKREVSQVLKRRHKKSFSKMEMSSKAFKWVRPFVAFAMLMMLIGLLGCENQMSTKRGVISGMVMDSNGNRIIDAIVTSHRSLFKAATDENGRFEFTSLDVGTHRLSVSRDGYYLASKTVDLGYGQELTGVNIEVEPLPEMISFSLTKRETNRAIIDIICKEPMSVWIAYREKLSADINTPPTQIAKTHQITLNNLIPGADYLLKLKERLLMAENLKLTVEALELFLIMICLAHQIHRLIFAVNQSQTGPVLTWNYNGIDPIQGFKLYRAIEDDQMEVLFDETFIMGNQTSFTDELTEPGKRFSYALRAVDLDGNVSSITEKLSIFPAGKLESDIVWKKLWSPIFIDGDIHIPAGKKLTIEPGVVVKISEEDGSQSGYSPSMCEFIVEGTFIASGTSARAN